MIKSNNWWLRTKSIDYRLIKFKSTRTFFSLLILSPVCVGIGKERSWRERERERETEQLSHCTKVSVQRNRDEGTHMPWILWIKENPAGLKSNLPSEPAPLVLIQR